MNDTPVKLLNPDDIFNSNRYELECVHVPEWGGHVFIRPMNVAQREQLDRAQKAADANIFDLTVLTLVLSVCDDQGILMFRDEDVPKLKDQPFEVVNKIFERITKLNNFGSATEEDGEGNDSTDKSGSFTA